MPYRATITLEVDISTTSEEVAQANANAIANAILPRACRLMETPSIELRVLRTADKPLIARMPNLPSERIRTALQDMSDDKHVILALCIKPRYSHVVYTALRQAFPGLTIEDAIIHVRELKQAGFLEVVNS